MSEFAEPDGFIVKLPLSVGIVPIVYAILPTPDVSTGENVRFVKLSAPENTVGEPLPFTTILALEILVVPTPFVKSVPLVPVKVIVPVESNQPPDIAMLIDPTFRLFAPHISLPPPTVTGKLNVFVTVRLAPSENWHEAPQLESKVRLYSELLAPVQAPELTFMLVLVAWLIIIVDVPALKTPVPP